MLVDDGGELEVDGIELEVEEAELEVDEELWVRDAEVDAGVIFMYAGSVKLVIKSVGCVLRFAWLERSVNSKAIEAAKDGRLRRSRRLLRPFKAPLLFKEVRNAVTASFEGAKTVYCFVAFKDEIKSGNSANRSPNPLVSGLLCRTGMRFDPLVPWQRASGAASRKTSVWSFILMKLPTKLRTERVTNAKLVLLRGDGKRLESLKRI